MTIKEALESVDGLLYNTYSAAEKIQWLSQLDWDIQRNIFKRYRKNGCTGFWGYGHQTDPETRLLVEPPYDQVYIHWLESQIHYYNGETDRYNGAIILFNNAMEAYARFYNRTHMPLSQGNHFLI